MSNARNMILLVVYATSNLTPGPGRSLQISSSDPLRCLGPSIKSLLTWYNIIKQNRNSPHPRYTWTTSHAYCSVFCSGSYFRPSIPNSQSPGLAYQQHLTLPYHIILSSKYLHTPSPLWYQYYYSYASHLHVIE